MTMSTTAPRFVRLDLPRVRSTSMSFSGRIPWSDALDTALSGLLNESDGIGSATLYRRSSKVHIVWISGEHEREQNEALLLTVEIEVPSAPPTSNPPRDIQLESVILDRLLPLADPVSWFCHVHFEYPAEGPEKYRSVFPLPMPFNASSSGLPFDEIRGVRALKRTEGNPSKISYSFSLDLIGEQELSLVVEFRLLRSLSSALPAAVLKLAREIAEDIVVLDDNRSHSDDLGIVSG